MDRPPRYTPTPLTPTEPTPEVSVSQGDTTVVDVGPPPDPSAGRAPKTPRWMLALIAAVIAIALYWWFAQTQRAEEVALNATVTAVNQATATADAANAAAAVAQATATASQADAQATALVQATAGAQQAADANATAGAQAAAADQARATAQTLAVDATVGALATQSAPAPTAPPTATAVVIVVTATPPAPATTTPPPPATAPAAPAPPSAPAPAPPSSAGGAPPAPAPVLLPSPAPVGQTRPPGSPAPGPAASPAASIPPVPRGGASSVTVTPGQVTTLRCLDNRVQIQGGIGALPAQTLLTCRPIDPGSVPAPAGPIIAETVFEVTSGPGNASTLPATLNLLVTYPVDASTPPDGRGLVLGYLDGDTWTELPEQSVQADQHRISSNINRAGVYGLYRQP
jgi:hypothetical protein